MEKKGEPFMKLNFGITYNIEIEVSQLAISELIREIKKVVVQFAKVVFLMLIEQIDKYIVEQIREQSLELRCPVCGGKEFTFKGVRKDCRKIKTSVGELNFPHLQMIRCKSCEHRYAPLLQVLGIERWQRVTLELKMKAVYSALHTTYRWARRITNKVLEINISTMSVWRAVQKFGSKMEFKVLEGEEGVFEADGTGIPIRGSGKRGKEMKLLVQHSKDGSIKLVEIGIGLYKSGWDFMSTRFKEIGKIFKEVQLVTDGDNNIIEVAREYVSGIIFQRCLWHMWHQLRVVLWAEGIKRSSKVYKEISSKLFSIITVRGRLKREEIDEKKIEEKESRLKELIGYCENKGLEKVAKYLSASSEYLFNFADKKLPFKKLVKTDSLIERMMREINFRINVAGSWSDRGALNITKLRLGLIYNKIELEDI